MVDAATRVGGGRWAKRRRAGFSWLSRDPQESVRFEGKDLPERRIFV